MVPIDEAGRLDADELATREADQKKDAASANPVAKMPDDVVSLSPFEVVSDTKGYSAANLI